jgi:tRNA G46 methylase TrmB
MPLYSDGCGHPGLICDAEEKRRVAMTFDHLDEQFKAVFTTNDLYFRMLSDFHRQHAGVTVEDEVKAIIARHCTAGARVLEAGCGEGSITNWFADRFPAANFVGVDISPIGISMACASAPANMSFHVGDITRTDLLSDPKLFAN